MRLVQLLDLPARAPRWPDTLVAAVDGIALTAALLVGLALGGTGWFQGGGIPPGGSGRLLLAGGAVAWLGLHLLALNHAALYQSHIQRSALEQVPAIVRAATYAAVVDLGLSYLLDFDLPRNFMVGVWGATVVGVAAGRAASGAVRRAALRRAPGGSPTLVVGSGPLAHRVVEEVEARPELGLRLVGYVEDGAGGAAPGGLRRFGDLDDLPLVVTTLQVGDVLLAGAPDRGDSVTAAVRSCGRTGARVSLVAPHPDLMLPFGDRDHIGPLPLIQLVHPRQRPVARLVRDIVDRVVGTLLFALALPLIAAFAVVVKVSSPGPVFFRQKRVGRGGRAFRVLKLRTMVDGAEARLAELSGANEADGPLFKIHNDPRVTRTGRWLRRTSLDELPQLWNVVKGEMSLVGPRPALPDEVLRYPYWFRRRLSVKPGITGLWQVSGRSRLSFTEAMRLDLSYVEGWSPWLDIQILLKTVAVVFRRDGA